MNREFKKCTYGDEVWLCHPDCPCRLLDEQSGASKSNASYRGLQHKGRHGGLADLGKNMQEGTNTIRGHNDSGGASRFFKIIDNDE